MLAVRGQFDVTLDGKGRLALPARLRERLPAQENARIVVVTYWAGALLGFGLPAWQQLELQLERISPFDLSMRDFLLAVVAGACEVELDAQGRVLVPANLRRRAALDGPCTVLSYLDRFEIWSTDRWEARHDAAIQAIEGGRATVPTWWPGGGGAA